MTKCDCDFCWSRDTVDYYHCKVFDALEERVKELEDAIRYHAAQRMNARCQLDDIMLYKLVGIHDHPGLDLPEAIFIDGPEGCREYWRCQQRKEKPPSEYSSVDYPWDHDFMGDPISDD